VNEGQHHETGTSLARRHRRVALRAGAVALFMLGMAFAAVPLYSMFCRVTGFAGTTQRANAPSHVILNRRLVVRFDGNVANGLAWSFEPVKRSISVRIGESRIAHFRATNLSDKTLTGQAAFNVAPDAVGAYFNKLACFCFTEQTLKPGQTVDMPVQFYVDPEFVKDRATRGVSQITLSYTFFPVETPGTGATVQRPDAKKGT
jgi:cytochrome c oxidase assembly protein subunit 11